MKLGLSSAALLGVLCAAPGCDDLSLTSVSPDAGPTTGGTVVTILGQGLSANGAVLFGGTLAVGVPVVANGGLMVTAPPHAAGAVDVTVTFSGGDTSADSAELVNAFTYVDAPQSDGAPAQNE
jgi:hypothetical protein